MSLETKRIVTREWRRIITRAWYDSFDTWHAPDAERRLNERRLQAETAPASRAPMLNYRPSEVDAWAE